MSSDPMKSDGFPPHSDGPSAEAQQPGRRSGGRRLIRLLVVLGVVALVAAPVAVNEFPHEMARWHEAQAIEHHLDGRRRQAYDSLAEALKWSPDNAGLYLRRAEWQSEEKEYALALKSCDRAIEIAPENLRAYIARSEIYHYLGQGAEAVGDWQTVEKINEKNASVGAPAFPDSYLLNGLAYAHAVGDFEQAAGLVAADRAIELDGGEFLMQYQGGTFLYAIDRLEPATRRLNRAVELVDEEYAAAEKQVETAEAVRDTFLGDLIEMKPFMRRRDDLQRLTAEAYFRRSRIHREAGSKALADADLARCKELEGNVEILHAEVDGIVAALKKRAKNYEIKYVIGPPFSSAAVLDTRGFLHYRLGNYEQALSDLNAAVDLSDPIYEQFLPRIESSYAIEFEPREAAREFHDGHAKSIAVMRYHRGLVYEKMGMPKQAQKDFDRVKELGFEPKPDLF